MQNFLKQSENEFAETFVKFTTAKREMSAEFARTCSLMKEMLAFVNERCKAAYCGTSAYPANAEIGFR